MCQAIAHRLTQLPRHGSRDDLCCVGQAEPSGSGIDGSRGSKLVTRSSLDLQTGTRPMHEATIIPFPLAQDGLRRPDTHTLDVFHLDLAALWLQDRGWKAEAGVYKSGPIEEAAGLSTDAPSAEVATSFVAAHVNLCGFLQEEFEYTTDELPLLCDMQPGTTRKARSGFRGGRIFGYV